jgi:hypothetical protein
VEQTRDVVAGQREHQVGRECRGISRPVACRDVPLEAEQQRGQVGGVDDGAVPEHQYEIARRSLEKTHDGVLVVWQPSRREVRTPWGALNSRHPERRKGERR